MTTENTVFSFLDPHFEVVGNMAFGTWKGYTLTLSPGKSCCLDVAVRIDPKDKALTKELSRASGKTSPPLRLLQNYGSGLRFGINFTKDRPYEEQWLEFMDHVVELLREHNIAPANTCAVCGGGSPDSTCCQIVSHMYSCQPVHSYCVKKSLAEEEEAAQRRLEESSYLTGILGALLGAIVGIIPSILTIVAVNRIYAAAFMLVPMASIYGYKLCKGKPSGWSLVIVIVFSLLSVFLMQYTVVTILIMQEYSLSLGEALPVLQRSFLNAEGLRFILSNSLRHFLFMVLGILLSLRFMKHHGTAGPGQTQKVVETLRPNPVSVWDTSSPEPPEE